MSISPIVNTATSRSALAWTPIALAAVVVALRIFVRIKREVVGTDDYLIVLSLVFALVSAGLAEGVIRSDPQTSVELGTLNAVSALASEMGLLSLAFAKFSVGFLLLRLIGPASRWHRWFLVSSMAVLAILTVFVTVAVVFADCKAVATSLPEVPCLTTNVAVGYIQSWNFYGVFVDIMYSLLPISIFRKVQLSFGKKLAVLTLLGLGWTAGIFTLLRSISVYETWDLPTTSFVVRLATAMEQGLIIICGSLATLAPLYNCWFNRKPLRPYGVVEISPTLLNTRSGSTQKERKVSMTTNY